MKKLFLLALLVAFGLRSAAQTMTLNVITPPCDSNGVVVATFTGATLPIAVQWSFNYPPYSVYDTITTGTTDTLYGFNGGNLSVYGGGAFDSLYYSPPFTVTVNVTPAACPALGTVNVTVSGATGPFTYKWENATTYAVVSTSNPATLPGGAYVVRATDGATGCVAGFLNGSFDMIINPGFTQTVTTTPAICPALGSGIVNVTGGTPPFSYSWTNPITGTVITSSTSPVSLPCCIYLERTTDALGCTVSGGSWGVGYVADFTATVTTTSADCTNGTATVALTGGTGPFSYLWSNGATTSSISGLVMGNYNVQVTDALGCVSSGLVGNVAQTITISVPTTPTPATCLSSDGSIIAFGSGGTPPYSFLWSTGATTQNVSGLISGNYNVTATDANGCFGYGYAYVNASTPITVTYSTTPSSCTSPTGTASLIISGGTAPYSITWYTTPVQTTSTATALSSGWYYFHVTDALGCIQNGSVYVPPIDVIYLSFTSSPATCLASDGSVSVSASGGVAPYTYSWSSGGTTASLTGVPYGLYYATVTDHNGCSVTNCQAVPYSSPLTFGLSTTQASCLYTHDGTITATASLGTPPYTYSMGGSSSGSVTVPGLATGSYWVNVTDALGCTAYDYTYVGYNVSDSSCFCVIQGTVYNDTNHNCVQDAGEVGIDHIQMECSGFGYTYTDASGYYYFLVPSGTYTVSQTVLSIYPLSPCQANNISVTTTAGTGCYHTINFADTLDPIHDMHISTWDYTAARPGFPYTQISVVTNDGTLTESNILAGYKADGQIFAPTIVPSGVFTGGTSYYYNTSGTFPALAPGAGNEFIMTYNVPADIPLGTNVIFKDSAVYAPPMTNWLLDYSPWNNVNYFTTTTVGSYDPNFKEVYPKGTGSTGVITTADSVLEYMVHFQNTGSYMAENVVVRDTLDANLNWASLKPVYSSGKCVVDMDDNGHVTFTFKNINLPTSSSEPVASNAMFTYTIKLKPGLTVGSQIQNRASIYFDFNAPIMTKRTLNTIGWPAGIQSFGGGNAYENSFTIYPNPADNTFNANINSVAGGTYSLKICDVTGKIEITKTLSLQKGSQTVTVDVNHLASGVYFVSLSSNNENTQTQKLVIMK